MTTPARTISDLLHEAGQTHHRVYRIVGLIQADITAAEWPAGPDPELSARLITATLHGMMAQWHLALGSFSWDTVADALSRD